MDRGDAQRADVHAAAGQRRFDLGEVAAAPTGLRDSDGRDDSDRPVLQPPERERDGSGRGRVQPLGVVHCQVGGPSATILSSSEVKPLPTARGSGRLRRDPPAAAPPPEPCPAARAGSDLRASSGTVRSRSASTTCGSPASDGTGRDDRTWHPIALARRVASPHSVVLPMPGSPAITSSPAFQAPGT